jgi:NADPH2:quinone reductase
MAERIAVDSARTFPVPDGLDVGLALAIGIAGLAGWLALELRARLQPGESVLVLGATGVVGQLAIQSAKLLGAGRVVAAGRDGDALERLRGADETVRLEGDLAHALKAASGEGFDVVVDPVFGAPLAAAIEASAMGARIVSVGRSASPTSTIALGDLFGRTLIGHSNSQATSFEEKRDGYAKLAAHAAAGNLTVEIERAPLADVSKIWQRQRAGSSHRKIVLIP